MLRAIHTHADRRFGLITRDELHRFGLSDKEILAWRRTGRSRAYIARFIDSRGPHDFELDGWRVLTYTWDDANSGSLKLIMQIGEILGLRPTRWAHLRQN
jgi:hypothetical protein